MEVKDYQDKIMLKGLMIQGYIGVGSTERTKKQNIIVNITMYSNLVVCGESDRIDDTTNYSLVAKATVRLVESICFYTLEALATSIARMICMDFGVERVLVNCAKPSAISLARCSAVEIERTREFFKKRDELLSKPKLISNTNDQFESSNKHIVYLGVGSNEGDRYGSILKAMKELSGFSSILSVSRLYETPPAYVKDQPPFLNCAVCIETSLSAEELLKSLKEIEKDLGRDITGGRRYGPRVIDLDILFYDTLKLSTNQLTIPHPLISERDFVLGPLRDINGKFIHPVYNQTVDHLFKALPSKNLTPVIPLNNGSFLNFEKKTLMMGILNITPDSFSDGGEYNNLHECLERAKILVEWGADILDLGGQSTRPKSKLISEEEEMKRVIPAIKKLREITKIPISIDTFYSKVAEEGIKVGANIINDISGGTMDEKIFEVAQRYNVPIVITHIRGTPQTMNEFCNYENVTHEVTKELKERLSIAIDKYHIPRWNIIIDPGFGFAKQYEHNIELLKNGITFIKQTLELPMLVGISRKGFIGKLLSQPDPSKRDWGTAATCVFAIQQGADILRVHDPHIHDILVVTDELTRS